MEAMEVMSQLLTAGVFIFTILIVCGLIGLAFYIYIKWKQYSQYQVVIFRKVGENKIEQEADVAGIFVERKSNAKRFWLKRHKVGLPPDNVPYIRRGSKKIVYLMQEGLKNFKFIDVDIKKGEVELSVTEEDVNWAINSYEATKKSFINSRFMEMLPYISLVVVSIIIMIIFVWFFKQFSVLVELGHSLQAASVNLQCGGNVI